MNAPLRLHLQFATCHESAVTSVLLAHHPQLPPFLLQNAQDGSTDQRVLSLVLPKSEATNVIVSLCAHAPSAPIVWWMERIESFGRLS